MWAGIVLCLKNNSKAVLFCFVFTSFPSAVSIFCDYGSCFFPGVFVVVFRALSIDKTFKCDREINEANKRQQIFSVSNVLHPQACQRKTKEGKE